MSSMSVDGLISGLNTTSLISSLMQLEAAPQNALKSSLAGENTAITALQSINTSLASVKTAATALTTNTGWQGLSATSSNSSVTVTSSSSAVTGQVTFDVLSTAASHVLASDPVTGLTATVASSAGLDITSGTTTTHIDLADTTLDGTVSAINAHPESGVTAQAVQVSSGVYRLQLTSTTSGAASAFTVSGLSLATGVVAQGADASVSVGTGAGKYTITSNTNTFNGVVPGVSFTVSALATGVSIATTRNPTAIASTIQSLVAAANAAKDAIAKQTAVASGGTSAGPLTSDTTVRDIDTKLSGLGTTALTGGSSLAAFGVQLDSSGKYVFDQTKFLAAYQADPAKAQAGITELANRFVTATTAATDPTTGTIAQEISGRNTQIRDLNTHIADWDIRLAAKQASLQARFSAMEVALGTLKSQSSWLTTQLASLTSTTTGK